MNEGKKEGSGWWVVSVRVRKEMTEGRKWIVGDDSVR